mmetsp:Transcript_49198/g.130259  ORF Transcript_49198/g.130259 Transcript_49198/m.130259 type:complete len:270 (-) Transcript_49198:584-1393(-)
MDPSPQTNGRLTTTLAERCFKVMEFDALWWNNTLLPLQEFAREWEAVHRGVTDNVDQNVVGAHHHGEKDKHTNKSDEYSVHALHSTQRVCRSGLHARRAEEQRHGQQERNGATQQTADEPQQIRKKWNRICDEKTAAEEEQRTRSVLDAGTPPAILNAMGQQAVQVVAKHHILDQESYDHVHKEERRSGLEGGSQSEIVQEEALGLVASKVVTPTSHSQVQEDLQRRVDQEDARELLWRRHLCHHLKVEPMSSVRVHYICHGSEEGEEA